MNWLTSLADRFRSKRLLGVRSSWANFGCGETFHPAWDNYDFRSCHRKVREVNLLAPLPLPQDSYEMVYCSHVLEHIPRDQAQKVISEFHRILRSHGVLRIVVPDLESIAREYLKQLEAALRGESGAKERHAWMCLELMDQFVRRQSGGFMARWWRAKPLMAAEYVLRRGGEEARKWIEQAGHESPQALSPAEIYGAPGLNDRRERRFMQSGERHFWAYDRFSLEELLRVCHFTDLQVCQAQESALENFASFGLDSTHEGDIRKPGSLYIEARKKKINL